MPDVKYALQTLWTLVPGHSGIKTLQNWSQTVLKAQSRSVSRQCRTIRVLWLSSTKPFKKL